MRLDAQRGRQEADLPYWFFQRVLEDGRLEVRSPGGFVIAVDPLDVCDVLPGMPVTVRAMPRAVFLERLKLAPSERNGRAAESCFHEADVLHITKDRWGRVDMVVVLFRDATLNSGGPWNAPIHPDDREALESKANRTWMPVVSPTRGAANHSADKGVAAAVDAARHAARLFIRCGLSGNTRAVSAIAMSGAKPLTSAAINRLSAAH